MAKKKLYYPEQINVLFPEGTRVKLVAIAFYRGQKGKYADSARDLIESGIAQFLAELSQRDRRVFDDILATVITSDTLRKAIHADGSDGSG